MTPVLEAERLGNRYSRYEALIGRDLSVPQRRVIGPTGPNGAGRSPLLNLAAVLVESTSGSVRVLGSRPAASAGHLAGVGFVVQNTPVHAELFLADHLRMGTRLTPRSGPRYGDRPSPAPCGVVQLRRGVRS
ncbi:ATP-binding cassette domain-containing protein, partial [Streptomyces sp. NPDC059092]|uniref:ATP-binding cassette domain-containing protein n=1 Tax=Streptomyces sp. NPDC059092 TaxID=3346725 RepID=UPI0036747383